MSILSKFTRVALLPIFFIITSLSAQTPGLIVKPAVAGKSVLDPNLDNYVSTDNEGFVDNDEQESEIPYVAIILPNAEPTGDLATGPSCGFTDMVDDASFYSSAYTYLSGANWLFRFRLGNYATNSKGYSILLDTDGLFGNSGSLKDPNYVTGNPGFEIEIILITNIGIRLNDVNGTTTPTVKTTLSYDDYSQKSVAYTTNCSNPDYFYDFYIPISVITTHFPSFNASTTVRMVANTVISTQSVLQTGPSDIAGVNDASYAGNFGNAWTSVINASLPTSPSNFNSGLPPVRSATPVVNSPLSVGATSVSGTSSEANGTVINVYVNGISVGTTTVSSGTWTLSGIPALTLSAAVKATATATSKSVSYDSNSVTVGATCSLVPSITCSSNKGIGGSGPTGAATGTIITIYGPNAPGTILTTTTTSATNTFLYNCAGGTTNCTGGGPNCIASGIFWVTAQESGKCESPKTTTICIGTTGTTSTPVISTNPILQTTTSLTGTATAGNTVLLYINGNLQSSTTATGGNWSFSGLSLTLGQVITVYALQSGQCISALATRDVTETSTAPIVRSPIITGATSVSGTSIEATGTTITLYKNGTSVGTTTVDANGNWTISGLVALVGGNLIKATATATGESASAFSNEVTVLSRSTAPTITGSYTEGATVVSGTSSAATGTVINVYLDGVFLGTTVTLADGTWTLSGIGSTDLYAGGILTATAVESGKTESLASASVTVACTNPSGSLGVNAVSASTCINTKAAIQVVSSQSSVIYTLRNVSNTTDVGSSVMGTGGTITLPSFRITTSQTFVVKAVKIPNTSCNTPLSTTASITVTQPSNTSGVASGDYFWTGSSANNYWTDDANWVQWDGTSFQTIATAPTATNNVVIKPMETCIANQPTVVTASSATIPAMAKNLTIASGATLSLENTVSERAITLSGNWSNFGTLIPNSGTIKFNGGTTQTISNASGSETFSSIIVEGTNTVLQPLVDVTLNSTGVLNLNAGALNLNGHKVTISNPSSSAIVRTTPGCIISESQNAAGELRWTIGSNTSTNYIFPMGTASKVYIPVTINLASGNIGTLGVNTIFATQSSSSMWPTGSEAVTSVATPAQAIRRYWHFSSTQAAGTYNATVTFSFANTEDPTATILDVSANGIKMQRWNGTSAWNDVLSGQTFSNTSPVRTVTVPGITQFSWWSGGNTGQSPLPIQLLYFTGYSHEEQSILEWATASETNNDFFSIERSKDGINYESVGAIPGGGNSTSRKNYSFTDEKPFPGLNYYRLKQTDFDRKYTYSKVIPIDINRNPFFNFILFPNPTLGEKPAFYIAADKQQKITVSLYDSFGILRFFTALEITVDKNNYSLETSDFQTIPNGIYFLKASNGDKVVTQTVVIN
ncbi:T9SS type A sorting domain-containing protein [Ohtaekwangia koreensis]|uniref:Por secretion system C-terminal sorting domain-containing protein n=1 Tax=Ohtaekwangia koreensis TaxID=688867 RepID=A0A1T5IXA9_9BACT|nr:T9SS type A sorting domain-containing protein [Ohtaekwangia koreensis]SKC43806.1 Por secretion system C-terminal sorting domain-containing protein [Ohtaekwangia koreensis]